MRMNDQPQLELCAAMSLQVHRTVELIERQLTFAHRLYQSQDYADLVIIDRDGIRHQAHKAVVCPRSGYLSETVKAEQWHDDIPNEIALDDEDPELVRFMLQYLYLLDYSPPPPSPSPPTVPMKDHDSDSASTRTDPIQYGQVYGASAISAFGGPRESLSGPSPYLVPYSHSRTESQLTIHALPGVGDYTALSHANRQRRRASGRSDATAPDPSPLATQEPHLVLHARVYAVAERYGLSGLKALALSKFRIQLTRHWDSSEFAEAIHVVYSSTSSSDKAMRECIADAIGWHGGLLNKPEVEVAIMDINGLAYELLKRSRRHEPEYME